MCMCVHMCLYMYVCVSRCLCIFVHMCLCMSVHVCDSANVDDSLKWEYWIMGTCMPNFNSFCSTIVQTRSTHYILCSIQT